MIRISVIAAILCFLAIQFEAGRGKKSLGKGKYYLVKTKDSSDELPMVPEKDQEAEEIKTPVPDHTVSSVFDNLEKLINKANEEYGDDYVGRKKKKLRELELDQELHTHSYSVQGFK